MRLLACAAVVLLFAVPAVAQDGAALYRQHCASCHDGTSATRAPGRDTIAATGATRIVEALETGVMREQGQALSAAERRAVATYLTSVTPLNTAVAPGSTPQGPACPSGQGFSVEASRDWNGWGVNAANDRFQRTPGLTAAQVPKLGLKWAFGFDGDGSAAVQPVIVGGRVFIGSASGRLYSLGLKDGCVHWSFRADGGIRAAVVVGPALGAATPSVYAADQRATVYSLDAATGQLRWKRRVETHLAARVSGTPVLHEGRLYVPVSSAEEVMGAPATYQCCTFRGSVVALDAGSGEVVWQTYVIPDTPKPTTKNRVGTQLWGPAGAAVWHAPTVDAKAGALYVATGDGYTHPAAAQTDAIVALDLKTGAMKWFRQMTGGDAWNMACGAPDRSNCPDPEGPDHDFGQPPILVTLPAGGRALVIGQKSGFVHAIDPDKEGLVLWSRRFGKGGMLGGFEWGSASDGQVIYAPLSDLAFKAGVRGRALDPSAGGGLFAIRLSDGSRVWDAAAASQCGDNCSPAQTAPPAVMPGVVFSGSLDGHLRAYASATGAIVWSFDTAREFQTVNGVKATGGSIDVGGPAVAYGMVLTTSGYATWGGKRGNVLLAFGVD